MNEQGTPAGGAGRWRLGDLEVNRLGFGAMRLTGAAAFHPGSRADRATSIRVLRRAIELGVDHIDTAAFYFSALRSANELINTALAPYPDNLVIATKVGPVRDASGAWATPARPDELRGQVEENLRQLGRDHLDLVNLRAMGQDSPGGVRRIMAGGATPGTAPRGVAETSASLRDEDVPAPCDAPRRTPRPSRPRSAGYHLAEHIGALAELREAGLVRHIGISGVRLGQLAEARETAPVVCVQNRYGIDDRDGEDVLRACGELGIAFVPFFSVAGQGREGGAGGPESPQVRTVARAHGVSTAQVRLAWSLGRGAHVLAIPGTGNPEHVADNVEAARLRLSAEETALLDTVAPPKRGEDPNHRR
ncbi:aldo/keto reductase [Streptomyces sp. NPDC005576]|uniref:aldo/keto reductase n=1 Tax=Streptomyces sp. NPDC005576 TaxID=3364726 RepID=UPI0036A038F4